MFLAKRNCCGSVRRFLRIGGEELCFLTVFDELVVRRGRGLGAVVGLSSFGLCLELPSAGPVEFEQFTHCLRAWRPFRVSSTFSSVWAWASPYLAKDRKKLIEVL